MRFGRKASLFLLLLFILVAPCAAWSAEPKQQVGTQPDQPSQKNDEATALNETAPESGKSNIVQDAEESPKKEGSNEVKQIFFQAMKYETGKGMEKDIKKAAELYALAAEKGHVQAQYKIGLMNEEGDGLIQNYRQAVKWYSLAAEQGHTLAQSSLARLYFDGEDVAQDYRLASLLARSAASQGDTEAQILLAKMYHYGNGMPEDYKAAVFWYRKAAEKGSDYAQYSLAVMYLYGKGLSRDPIEAYAWANISAAQGYYEAKELREEIARALPGEKLIEAQNRSKIYYKKYVEPF
ncbi:MAG: sel1 repeat family protein [Alphaproteobacteria bacterium]|jgi:TPR repeat protein|nr:sel1 repeat family protein [Alphaproteobacteria bacterium]QQS58132.1 MAG: sel1 repeat family protein [Alphaproteobacteria bacterium]